MQVTEQRYYSPEDYLALEEAADFKSEYINGEIFLIQEVDVEDESVNGS